MKIDYSASFTNKDIHPRDILDCLNDFLSDCNNRFNCDVLTFKSYETETNDFAVNMIRVKVRVVVFNVPNENIHYEWTTFRDKNFHCCSGRGFKKLYF